MNARETILKNLLEGTRQYVVPLYQRRYAWTKTDWDTFWAGLRRQYDVLEQGVAENRATHFFGSFVLQPLPGQASGPSAFAVIDGQQRLTTVFVLLAALRDLWGDETEADRLTDIYLVNKYLHGEDRYKMRPGIHDRSDMRAIVDAQYQLATGLIGTAYRFFRNALDVQRHNHGLDFATMERAIIQRLEVVDITTDSDDNAHRIFQTLNSTGRGLTQVDLLRNHFFMLLPTRADEAYQSLWEPLEKSLGDYLELFLWVDMVSRGGGRELVSRDRVYARWQHDLEPSEHDENEVYEALRRLARRGDAYRKIIDPSSADAVLAKHLRRLNEWGANVHHPVLLRALVLMDDNTIQRQDVVEVIAQLESFLVRRLLARVPTNNLNRIFTTTVGQVPASTAFAQDLRKVLSSPGKYWPTNAETKAAILAEPFYWTQRPAQRQFVLRRLEESFPGPERPDWSACTYTVEHVMPQHLSPAWHTALEDTGETDPVAAHAELVHTLGNVTLTCENTALSDSPMQRKQEIYQRSMLRMNQELGQVGQWGRAAIRARGERLARQALSLWPGPVQVAAAPNQEAVELISRSLAIIPEGRWTTLNDLAEVANVSSDTVRDVLIATTPSLAGRNFVLKVDGTPDTSLPWVVQDLAGYRLSLVGVGVLDDATDQSAPPSRRHTADDFAGLLGEQ